MRGKRGERLNVIRGSVPNPFNMPTGCNFPPAARSASSRCATFDPRVDEGGDRRRLLAVEAGAAGGVAEPAPRRRSPPQPAPPIDVTPLSRRSSAAGASSTAGPTEPPAGVGEGVR